MWLILLFCALMLWSIADDLFKIRKLLQVKWEKDGLDHKPWEDKHA